MLPLTSPFPPVTEAHFFVEVRDLQGNVTRVDRKFATVAALVFEDGFETGDTSRWDRAQP